MIVAIFLADSVEKTVPDAEPSLYLVPRSAVQWGHFLSGGRREVSVRRSAVVRRSVGVAP